MAEEEEKESPEKGSSMKLILIGAVVILLLGGGGAFFLLKKPPGEEAVAVEAKVEAKVEVETEGIIIYSLEPFIVNLADSQESRYLKVTLNLDLLKPEYSEDITAHLPQIRDSLLILFSSKNYAGIRTVEGKMELRDEILQRINGIFNGERVKMAYFMDFVTQ